MEREAQTQVDELLWTLLRFVHQLLDFLEEKVPALNLVLLFSLGEELEQFEEELQLLHIFLFVTLDDLLILAADLETDVVHGGNDGQGLHDQLALLLLGHLGPNLRVVCFVLNLHEGKELVLFEALEGEDQLVFEVNQEPVFEVDHLGPLKPAGEFAEVVLFPLVLRIQRNVII